MSLTSNYGRFELTSFVCNNNLLLGRNAMPSTANVTLKIKNLTGEAVDRCSIFISRWYTCNGESKNMISDINSFFSNIDLTSEDSKISWANNSEYTFSGSISFKNSIYQEIISYDEEPTPLGTLQIANEMNAGLRIIIRRSDFNIDTIRLNQDETDRFMPVWLKPFKPNLRINAVRCNAMGTCEDEGDHILIAAKLDISNGFSYNAMINAGYTSTPSVELNGNSIIHSITLNSCLTGIFEFTIDPTTGASIGGTSPAYITQEIPASTDYKLRVEFEDAFEPCSAEVYIFRAFANLHLSEYDDGGACFGGFCKRTVKGKPQFESYYASVFHKPIKEENGTPIELTIGSKFGTYHISELKPTLRAFGNVVTLQGEITPLSSITAGTAQHVICTIPEKYAPSYMVTTLQQGTGQTVWLLRVYPKTYIETNDDDTTTDRSCTVTFARYRNGSGYTAANAGDWLPFHATWISPHTFEDE